MNIITIIGTRPQLIKSKILSQTFKKYHIQEQIIHTSQHYDPNMSDVFFTELDMQPPLHTLKLAPNQTRLQRLFMMSSQITPLIKSQKPDFVLVYGDTDSTLAGAFSAHLCHIPLIHIEAGLRSLNHSMPEEQNRILTDSLARLLFTPTTTATKNLINEKIPTHTITQSGDIVLDLALYFATKAKLPKPILLDSTSWQNLNSSLPQGFFKHFCLATLHRSTNLNKQNLESIFKALDSISAQTPILFPLHPHTKTHLLRYKIAPKHIIFCQPLSYLEMSFCLQNAICVFSDSGGLQRESFFFKKPHITLREESEWQELLTHRFSILTGADTQKILSTYHHKDRLFNTDFSMPIFGNGRACEIIAKTLKEL